MKAPAANYTAAQKTCYFYFHNNFGKIMSTDFSNPFAAVFSDELQKKKLE